MSGTLYQDSQPSITSYGVEPFDRKTSRRESQKEVDLHTSWIDLCI